MQYEISSKAGVVYGIYEGENPDAALAAMHTDAGYRRESSGTWPETAGQAEDWIIVQVETP